MNLALDLRACQFPQYATRGIGSYSKHLANAILAHGTNDRYTVFGYQGIKDFLGTTRTADRSMIEVFGGMPMLVNQRTFPYRKRFESAYFDRLSKKHGIDVVLSFLSGDGQVKVDAGKDRALVRVFYDLIPLLYSEQYLPDEQGKRTYSDNLKEFERSDAIITISERSKKDLLDHIDFDGDKVTVIYPGIGSEHLLDEKPGDTDLSAYGIHHDFLLYVGGYDFRKNVESIIEAFARQEQDIRRNLQLVLVGEIGRPQKDTLMRLAKRRSVESAVVFTGFVPDVDLGRLYRQAEALVYPSLYEGFGLTVLEAMANGCPVITSNNSSLGEVAKDYALTFDPENVDEITAAMRRIITDGTLRENLRTKARGYAATYSWERTARETVELLRSTAAKKGTGNA